MTDTPKVYDIKSMEAELEERKAAERWLWQAKESLHRELERHQDELKQWRDIAGKLAEAIENICTYYPGDDEVKSKALKDYQAFLAKREAMLESDKDGND